ncbi:MAG: hypothetical protein DRP94_04020 [Candidatus Latescibacterota bacterium]|nr:MAG: hypothetical protein DRP94_04020 [Candidatus Latescibacterota bacterium]
MKKVVGILSIYLASCARVAPPPGGPPDRTPPEVVRTYPEDGETSVPSGRAIEVTFSEHMDERSVERAFFLYPKPERPLKFKWRGRKLKAEVPGGLRPERTYVVTVGASARDLHGNEMGNSYTFAFSTGRRIYEGRARGMVWSDEAVEGPVHIRAYLAREGEEFYETQADSSGRFVLSHLAPGTYRIFAFEDRNRDGGYSPGREPFAVPPEEVEVGEEEAKVPLLRLALRDTTSPEVLGVRTPNRRTLTVRFDEEVVLDSLRASMEGLELSKPYTVPGRKGQVFWSTGPQHPRFYTLHLSGVGDVWGNFRTSPEELRFKGNSLPDTVPPKLVKVLPDTALPLRTSIKLVFDEAMARVRPSKWRFSPEVSGKWTWSAPNILSFEPDGPWKGGRYELEVPPGALRDVSGNFPADTIEVGFYVLPWDSLGEIAGRVSGAAGPVVVEAREVEDSKVYRTRTEGPGSYELPVPGGRYTVCAFRDRDGDGRWSPGRPEPFLPAERFGVHPDTVDVRARWRTEGIDISL